MHSERNTDRDCITVLARVSDVVVPAVPALRIRQPWARLLKAILDLAGAHAELISHGERDWVSATFSGSRHAITLGFAGPAATAAGEAFIMALPDCEFTIPRYLVADAQVVGVDDCQLPERRLIVEIQLLLLERA